MKPNTSKTEDLKEHSPKHPHEPVPVVGLRADGSSLDVVIKEGKVNVSDLRRRSIVVAGDHGTVVAGERGAAIAGFESDATAQREGLAYVMNGSARCIGHSGIAITCAGGTASAVDRLAVTYRGGHAIMGGAGIAIAINEKTSLSATAQAGRGGLIILGYRKTENGPLVYVACAVDGKAIQEDQPYALDENYCPHLAPRVS